MSDIEVLITPIEILPHPNADKLEIGRVFGEGGYESIVGLGQFEDGELAIYIPPDSIVSPKIQEHLDKNKITVKNGRIRAIKIRGVLSEGLCLKPSEWLEQKDITEGKDVKKLLGITKYEPPPPGGQFAIFKRGKGVSTWYKNDRFYKYECISHFKKYPRELKEGEEVVITIKRHGTNARAGVVDKPASTLKWWQRLRDRVFGKKQRKEFLVGSHNTIRKPKKDVEWDTDLYLRAAKQYDLESVARQIAQNNIRSDQALPDVIIYSEICGFGVQRNYNYGCEEGEIEIRVFDIMIDKKFLPWDTVKHLCDCFNLPTVEEVYVGAWSLDLLKYAEAIDEYNGQKYEREGIVIKPAEERTSKCGRVALKYLSAKYLLSKQNTDYH